MPSATTAARNGRHFLRTVDIATPFGKWGADRLLAWVNVVPCVRLDGVPDRVDSPFGQVEAQPRRRKSVLTRKWHARFPEVSGPVRQEANGRCGSWPFSHSQGQKQTVEMPLVRIRHLAG